MASLKVSLLKGDRISDDIEYRSNLPVNMVATLNPVHGVPGFMSAHPGYEKFDTAVGADRGGVWNERLNKHFRVSGGSLIKWNFLSGVSVIGPVGGLNTREHWASMPYSFNSQLIVTGRKAYLSDGFTLTQITDPDIGEPIDATWIDGYYFFTDGEYLYHSDIEDETAIDPLKFATSEFSPDPTLGLAKTQDNQVVVFNRYTTEFFYNAATAQFAFTRSSGKAVKSGIIGTHMKIEMDGQFYCMGSAKDEAPTMIAIGAGRATNFSTRDIDFILQKYTEFELGEGKMSTRTEDRNQFIYVHLPEHTLVFNATIAASDGIDNAWAVLKTGTEVVDSAGAVDSATILTDTTVPIWDFINPVYDTQFASWVGGDVKNSNMYSLSPDSSAQNGEPAEHILTSPFLYLEGSSIDSIELDTIPGRSDEEVMVFLSITYDGLAYGKEWSLHYSDGPGDNTRRFIYRRLGYCRNWMGFKFRIVTKSKLAFANMTLESS